MKDPYAVRVFVCELFLDWFVVVKKWFGVNQTREMTGLICMLV